MAAAGADQGEGFEDFARIHQMLRDHHVALVMAGDTHDLEYYVEPPVKDGTRPM